MKRSLLLFACLFVFCAGMPAAQAAISATAEWDINANAAPVSATYGGGFYVSGGTDYSQQAAPELELTDVATNTSTTLTSATGGFTSAMVGNGLYLDDDGEWYEVASYVSTNEITVDRATNDTGANRTIAIGGAVPLVDAVIEEAQPGMTFHVKSDGTYTFGADVFTSLDGDVTARVTVSGYDTTHGDLADTWGSSDRPVLDTQGWQFTVDDYWRVEHLTITGTDTYLFNVGLSCVVTDVRCINTSTTANRAGAVVGGVASAWTGCEFVSPAGDGCLVSNNAPIFLGCYFHDSATGCDVANSYALFIGCMFDTCTTGASVTNTKVTERFVNCTIFNCVTGVGNGTTVKGNQIVNCIFRSCGTALSSGDDWRSSHFVDYNVFYGNSTDVSNVAKGPNTLTSDPELTITSWTDLACADHAGPPYDLTSATAGFSAVFSVNEVIRITNTGDTAHFVAGCYVIDSVADGSLGLHTDPTDGNDETGGVAAAITDWTPGDEMKAAGTPSAIPGTGATTYIDIGALQLEAASGGTVTWGSQ